VDPGETARAALALWNKRLGRGYDGNWNRHDFQRSRPHIFGLDLFSQPPELSGENYTRQAFEAHYAEPIGQATSSGATDFLIQTRRDFLPDIRKSVSALQPDIALTFNGAGMADMVAPKSAAQVDALEDLFSMMKTPYPTTLSPPRRAITFPLAARSLPSGAPACSINGETAGRLRVGRRLGRRLLRQAAGR
jgi:hypothetical protein